jgi:hypothetical protein
VSSTDRPGYQPQHPTPQISADLAGRGFKQNPRGYASFSRHFPQIFPNSPYLPLCFGYRFHHVFYLRHHNRDRATPRPLHAHIQRQPSSRNHLPLPRSRPLRTAWLRNHARTHPRPANPRTTTNNRTMRPMHQRRLLPRNATTIRRRDLAAQLPSTSSPRRRRLPQPTNLHRPKSQPPPPAQPPIRPHPIPKPNRPYARTPKAPEECV